VGLLGVESWAFVNNERGASWLIGRGLNAYDGGVEGKLSYSKSEGSFQEDIPLSDLELRDHDGRLLIPAKHVTPAASPSRYLLSDGELRDFIDEGGTVILPADGEPGFEDLRGPPRDDDERDDEPEDELGAGSGSLAVSMHVGGFELR